MEASLIDSLSKLVLIWFFPASAADSPGTVREEARRGSIKCTGKVPMVGSVGIQSPSIVLYYLYNLWVWWREAGCSAVQMMAVRRVM